jgi:hypothetical protein
MKYGGVSWRNSISFAARRKAAVTQNGGFISLISNDTRIAGFQPIHLLTSAHEIADNHP